MQKKILLIGIGAGTLLAFVAIAAWILFGTPSEDVVVETPSPSPSEAALPSSSPTPLPYGGVCSDTWVSGTDTDRDGMPDSVEKIYGTDPNNADTDGDGYTDGEEVRAGYNPLSAEASDRLDSDNDGLLDNDECIWATDPFNPDSDGDGFQDGAEVSSGFDPTKKGDGDGSDRIPVATPEITPAPFITTTPQAVIPSPSTSNPSGTPSARFTLIPFSQLQITSASAPADVRGYISQIDALRPSEFSDGQAIATAIQSAANGNVQQLTQVRGRIAQFSASLKGVATPRPAQEYHQLYVSLIDFTVQQLQIIEQNATGSNQQRAVQAVVDIQNILPAHVSRLAQLRQTIEGYSNQ